MMSGASSPFVMVALTVYLTAVAIIDLNTHRIPNRLTVPAAIVALGNSVFVSGAAGALHSVEGLAIGLGAFLPMFLAGGTGAGDVKAMAAVGAFLGPAGAFFAVLWTMVAGLVGALVVLAAVAGTSGIRELLRRWIFRAYVLCTTGRAANVGRLGEDAARRRFPYGLAIAVGTLASLTLGVYRG